MAMTSLSLKECKIAFSLGDDYTQEDIKKVYRKLVMKSHPDHGGDSETFNRITTMRDMLIDSLKPKTSGSSIFDSIFTGRKGSPDFSDFNFDEFFRTFGGNSRAYSNQDTYNYRKRDEDEEIHYTPKNKPKTIHQKLDLDYIIISSMVEREITIPDEAWCTACYGRGSLKVRERRTCPICSGRGTRRIDGLVSDCSTCNGNGWVFLEPCRICKGKGKATIHRKGNLKLKPLTIPEKIHLGDNVFYKLEITEKSSSGKWFRQGLDLNRLLKVDAFNLIMQKEIEWRDLLTGKKYEISFREPFREGTKMKLPNMGLSNGFSRGDMIIHIEAEYPNKEDLSDDLIQAMKRYR